MSTTVAEPTPHRRRHLTVRGAALGALLAMSVTAAAAAVEPYEPDESAEQGDYPDQPGYDDPPGGGGTGTVPEHPPVDDGCSTTWDEDLDTDVVKLLDRGIDFGDGNWVVNAPVGVASVPWSVECGLYRAEVVGTLHLDGVRGRSGRVHVSFWNSDGLVETRHSRTRTATTNGHQSWPVSMSPSLDVHVLEVHVCTEISDDGVHFDSVNCKTRYAG